MKLLGIICIYNINFAGAVHGIYECCFLRLMYCCLLTANNVFNLQNTYELQVNVLKH